MPAIPGTVIGSRIVPTDSLDEYETHDALYGKDGWRSVDSIATRDAITAPRRREGMVVYVIADGTPYQLQGGIDNVNWQPLPLGGGGGTVFITYTGVGAPSAGLGVDDETYLDTATGDFYQKQSGSWIFLVNIKGPAGTNGVDGTVIYSGSVAPSTLYVDGDFYLNVTTGELYKQISNAWVFQVNLTGPQGPVGPTGSDGTDGNTILNGITDPDVGTGVAGDFYINTATSTIFGPKTTVWGSGTSLVGLTGDTGSLWYFGTDPNTVPSPRTIDYYLHTSTGDVYSYSTGSWVVIDNLTGPQGLTGLTGATGASAYEVAVANGFVGDETAWLASLVGPTGPAGGNIVLDVSSTGLGQSGLTVNPGTIVIIDDSSLYSEIVPGSTNLSYFPTLVCTSTWNGANAALTRSDIESYFKLVSPITFKRTATTNNNSASQQIPLLSSVSEVYHVTVKVAAAGSLGSKYFANYNFGLAGAPSGTTGCVIQGEVISTIMFNEFVELDVTFTAGVDFVQVNFNSTGITPQTFDWTAWFTFERL